MRERSPGVEVVAFGAVVECSSGVAVAGVAAVAGGCSSGADVARIGRVVGEGFLRCFHLDARRLNGPPPVRWVSILSDVMRDERGSEEISISKFRQMGPAHKFAPNDPNFREII